MDAIGFVLCLFFCGLLLCILWVGYNTDKVKCKRGICNGHAYFFYPLAEKKVFKVKTDKLVRINDTKAARVIEYYREFIEKCDTCQYDCSVIDKSQKLGTGLSKPQNASICSSCKGVGKIRHKIHGTWWGGHVEMDCAVCKGEPIKISRSDDSE